MGLYVDGPSTPSQRIASGGANQTLSGTFDAGAAPNGTFTVTLKGEITGNRYATSTFKLRRPAEAPGGVNASRQGTGKVLVTWSKGSEPDLQSYEVSNTQSGVVGRLSADSACSGSSCKAVLAVPSKAAGQKVGFSVKAFRGDGDGGSVGSGDSAAAYVTFPAPPAAQPTKKATESAQAPKNRDADAQGAEALPTLPARKPKAVSSSKPTTATARKPTTTKLPDIPDADPSGNLPIPTAGDDQGENGGLVPADAKDEADEAPVQSDGVKAQSSESSIGNIGQYGLYVAGGILLLLLGAHAGAWARRRALATGPAGGPAAPAVGTGMGTGMGTGTTATTTAAGAGTRSAGAALVHDAHTGPQVVAEEDVSTSPVRGAVRRPAVILAVAKTRIPEQPAQPSPPSQASGSGAERSPLGARDQQAGREGGSSLDGRRRWPGEGAESPLGAASGVESPMGSAAAEPSRRVGAGVPPYGATPGRQEGLASDRMGGKGLAVERMGGKERAEHASGRVRGEGAGGGGVVPKYGAGEELVGGVRGRQEDRDVQQGPLHIALPSSAVTDVPESTEPTVAPAVRLEERWDDYLPPSPRSMEDSGFWERPQPGAADFWAADSEGDDSGDGKGGDGRTYVGRRHRGGES
ncbi:hypothetical protein GCM10009850_122440 [Nonomuraea monospora]|uniref:Uncharacterized protein n=2 Tax=Nonomuraea monospora TaxID=568818 RepID=A0ABN3D5W4_9ACTN